MTNSGVRFRMVCSVSRWEHVKKLFQGGALHEIE